MNNLPTTPEAAEVEGPKPLELRIPLKAHPHCAEYMTLSAPGLSYVDKAPNLDSLKKQSHSWKLGQDYDVWVKTFFIRMQKEYDDFQALAKTLQEQITTPSSLEDSQDNLRTFQKMAEKLMIQINKEKPAWRFKWGIWPIKTKGWPFNRQARKFADTLIQQFENIIHSANESLNLAGTKEPSHAQGESGEIHHHVIDLKLTELDKQILQTEQDPAERLEKAKQLSAINQLEGVSSAPENTEVAQGEIPPHECAEAFFKKIQHYLISIKTSSPRTWVNKSDEAKNELNNMLAYRDQLEQETAMPFIEMCERYIHIIGQYASRPALTHNQRDELSLITALFQVLKAASGNEERANKKEAFFMQCDQVFSQREARLMAANYAGDLSPRTNPVSRRGF